MFATCGEAAKAETVASELGKNYPLNTLVQKLAIPQIHARVELQHGNSAKAIEQLRPTEAYQFGYIAGGVPAYLRGLAYLQAKQGPQAVTEFQTLLDHKSALGRLPLRVPGPARPGSRLCSFWRHRQSSHRLPGLLHPVERCRPGYPHPEGSQDRIRKVAVAGTSRQKLEKSCLGAYCLRIVVANGVYAGCDSNPLRTTIPSLGDFSREQYNSSDSELKRETS